MYTTTKALLDFAQTQNSAIAAFNCYNAETTQAAINAAQETEQPVIIAYGERYQEYMNLEAFAAFTQALAKQKSVNISLHLDHSYEFETIKRAIDAGFSSVMYDGSTHSLEDNVRHTKEIVDYAHKHGVFVEAEIGSMKKGAFSDEEEGDGRLTDPDEAALFVKETGVDFLAASIGTVHGMYEGEPEIRLDLLEEIKEKCSVPLVLHGGSGTPENQVLQAIDRGIRKINVNTEISLTAAGAIAYQLNKNANSHLSTIMEYAQSIMTEHMKEIITLYKNSK
ncbi:putative aldolase [Bacillus sp. TS-2]|nr:putative aldolase [Bacillus sp. TS-2]